MENQHGSASIAAAMMPVLSPQDIDTLPIRDGSTLDALHRHDDMA